MPELEGIRNVLLDIEGTICPISFVKDTLFPYALKALPDVLAKQWDDPVFRAYRDAFPEEHRTSPAALQAHVEDLTKRDVKIAYLKNLQGYLWKDGYKSGAYSAPLFYDVVPKLKQWKADGVRLAIYSSGSVFAQKLLFQHVELGEAAVGAKRSAGEAVESDVVAQPAKKSRRTSGGEPARETAIPEADHQPSGTEDLRHFMIEGGWFDTTNAGPKTEATSYWKIMDALGWQPAQTLFLTDSDKEYEAAEEAAVEVVLLDRSPGNAIISGDREVDKMEVAWTFDDIDLVASEGDAVVGPSDSSGTSKVTESLKEAAADGVPAELDGVH